jgi:hypothetical protein
MRRVVASTVLFAASCALASGIRFPLTVAAAFEPDFGPDGGTVRVTVSTSVDLTGVRVVLTGEHGMTVESKPKHEVTVGPLTAVAPVIMLVHAKPGPGRSRVAVEAVGRVGTNEGGVVEYLSWGSEDVGPGHEPSRCTRPPSDLSWVRPSDCPKTTPAKEAEAPGLRAPAPSPVRPIAATEAALRALRAGAPPLRFDGAVVGGYRCPPCPQGAHCKPCLRQTVVYVSVDPKHPPVGGVKPPPEVFEAEFDLGVEWPPLGPATLELRRGGALSAPYVLVRWSAAPAVPTVQPEHR